MTLLDNFPHRATAKKRRRTKGTLGGSSDSFPTTVFTNRECWRQPAGDSEITEYQKRGMTITDKVYFLTDPRLDTRHALEIGGDTLEVRSRSLPDASAGLGVVWRVMAEMTTTGSAGEVG